MEKQKKSAMVGIPVIILAVSAMFLSASPCAALEVPLPSGETTLDVDGTIDDPVIVNSGGTLNLLDGGFINGGVTMGEGGVLNMKGGYISGDVLIANSSEVNIKGGDIGGDMYWDIYVSSNAMVTVYGTDFDVMYGTIDSSGTYFTQDDVWPPCELTGKYGGDAGDIDLRFYIPFTYIRIFLAPPDSEVMDVVIDIKPGSEQNSINLKSKGVVPVAVLATADFFVEMINLDTVNFAGAKPVHWSFEDVDEDGKDDIIFHFRTQELYDLDQNSTEATLKALLLNGDEVSGTDEVRIVPSKKK
jgi:hypothetical protein